MWTSLGWKGPNGENTNSGASLPQLRQGQILQLRKSLKTVNRSSVSSRAIYHAPVLQPLTVSCSPSMRVSLSTVAAMTVALASGVDAFWLVTNTIEGGLGGPVGGTGNQWSFVSNPDSCDEVTHAERYNQYSDVSGPGTGIRIKWKKGSGSECDKFLGCQVPDIVEMHREQWHWSTSF